jgi:chromosome segregation ATPase
MNQLDEKVKDFRDQNDSKTEAFKQQLRDVNRQADKSNPDGPADKMRDALAKGDLEKAQEEMDKLAKKIKEDKLTDEERKELQKQLDEMKKRADEASQKQKDRDQEEKALENKIQEAKKQGKDAKELERQLQQLQQQKQSMKDLQDLAQKMENCKQCMEKGDMQGAAEQLQKAADALKNMGLTDKDLQDLQDQLQKAKDACCKGNRAGDMDGEQNQPSQGFAQGKSKGQNTPANGPRPQGKDGKTGSFDARQKVDFDPKGKKIFEGLTPGQNFRAKSGPEIASDVQQAAQEAPEAVERQNIPKAARDMAKGYFRNLGGQYDKKK